MSRSQRSARRKSPAIDLGPLYLLIGVVVVVVVGVGVAGYQNAKRKEDAAQAAAVQAAQKTEAHAGDPFGDLPDEVPKGAGARGGRWKEHWDPGTEPTGILASDLWQESLRVAEGAWLARDQGDKARRDSRMNEFQTYGREAIRIFDEALNMSAEWEQKMLDEHGDLDPKVREVVRTRDEWFEQTADLRRRVPR